MLHRDNGIYSDSKDKIYFSTRYNGVYVYNSDNKILENYSKDLNPESNIDANMIRPVYEDKQKNLWIGTKEGGLKLLNKETNKFITYNINNGLPSNMILNIQEDLEGNIWLGTNLGISKFDVKNKNFTNFNTDHGLKSLICEQGRSYIKDGALLIGGNNGFNIFYPDDITKNDKTTPLLMTSIKIFDEELYFDINHSMELNLTHDQNYISFEFILTDYNEPGRHQFKCLEVSS